MSIIRNLFFLFAITLFAITSTVLAVFNYNPYTSGVTNLANFYVSFFISVTGIFGLVIYYYRSKRVTMSYDGNFWASVRQASFISAALTLLLLLKGLKILDVLISISVLIVFLLLELFFKTKKIT